MSKLITVNEGCQAWLIAGKGAAGLARGIIFWVMSGVLSS